MEWHGPVRVVRAGARSIAGRLDYPVGVTGPADSADEDPGFPGIGLPTPVPAPAAVRGAVRARLLAQTLGRPAPPGEPTRLGGRYRLVREIGRGGMGVVWEAELEPLGKRVAIKLLRRAAQANPGPAARFLREALAVSAVGHEHIVKVDDFGTDERGEPYLVMELLAGRSLAAEIEMHGPLPWSRAARILRQLCGALEAAHRHGIVHRDLKPANVFLVRRDDGRDFCKLLDFGLCKPLDGSVPVVLETHAGAMLGTPAYMAPEQIEGLRVDGRADLYALGCVAYEMLTGRLAFAARRADEVFDAHLHGERPTLDVEVPPGVASWISRALARDRGQRFADAAEMAAAIPGDPLVLRRARSPRPAVRGRTIALGVALGTASLLGGAAVALVVPVRPPTVEREPAAAILPADPRPAPTPAIVESKAVPPAPVQSTAEPAVVAPAAVRTPTRPRRVAPAKARDRAAEPAPSTSSEPRKSTAADSRLVDGIRDPFANR